uniref:Uncharacterized protein n=1 Tax=virus sp. ctLpa4 TaxID=2825814 RepID=A0A8S5RLK1_9VIRU|nr:MAG TPA: hypothetical protein [virus sp. ctLpa4]
MNRLYSHKRINIIQIRRFGSVLTTDVSKYTTRE